MNERIKELAQEAYEDVIKNTPSFLVTKELHEQKFAELIVRDCIDIASQDVMMKEGYPRFCCSQTVKKIREHFGVKE